MKATRRNNFVLAALIGFGILMGAMLLAFGGGLSETRTQMLLAGVIIVGTVVMGFWLRGLSELKTARLIEENSILHIHTAVISDLSGETTQQPGPESTEVIVSYFGILMDEKIIKFNQDGIRLRAVEIGGDFISFTYGTKKRIQNIRLLRPALEAAELDEIMEKFRYETGVTPTLLP